LLRVRHTGVVLVFNEEDLETFPTERLQLLDGRHHVFLPVQFAHAGIELEFNAEFLASVVDTEELLGVLASGTPYEHVGGLVKAITGNAKDVHELAILIQPSFRDFSAVRDDRDALQAEHFLAVTTQPAKVLRIEERLATSEVYLANSGVLEKTQAVHYLLLGCDVRSLLRVEAELASLVALSGEVVIDRNAVGTIHGRAQVLVFGIDANDDGKKGEDDQPWGGREE
jgi:hypothetical protein